MKNINVCILLFGIIIAVTGITLFSFSKRPVLKTVIVDTNKALDEEYNNNPQAFWHWLKNKDEQIIEMKKRISELELLERKLFELESKVKSNEKN